MKRSAAVREVYSTPGKLDKIGEDVVGLFTRISTPQDAFLLAFCSLYQHYWARLLQDPGHSRSVYYEARLVERSSQERTPVCHTGPTGSGVAAIADREAPRVAHIQLDSYPLNTSLCRSLCVRSRFRMSYVLFRFMQRVPEVESRERERKRKRRDRRKRERGSMSASRRTIERESDVGRGRGFCQRSPCTSFRLLSLRPEEEKMKLLCLAARERCSAAELLCAR